MKSRLSTFPQIKSSVSFVNAPFWCSLVEPTPLYQGGSRDNKSYNSRPRAKTNHGCILARSAETLVSGASHKQSTESRYGIFAPLTKISILYAVPTMWLIFGYRQGGLGGSDGVREVEMPLATRGEANQGDDKSKLKMPGLPNGIPGDAL